MKRKGRGIDQPDPANNGKPQPRQRQRGNPVSVREKISYCSGVGFLPSSEYVPEWVRSPGCQTVTSHHSGTPFAFLCAVCMISSKEKGSPDRNSISGFCLTALAMYWDGGAACEEERSGGCKMKEGGRVVCQLEPFEIVARGWYVHRSFMVIVLRPSIRAFKYAESAIRFRNCSCCGKGEATRRDSTVYRKAKGSRRNEQQAPNQRTALVSQ
jgi:hypothetical protein